MERCEEETGGWASRRIEPYVWLCAGAVVGTSGNRWLACAGAAVAGAALIWLVLRLAVERPDLLVGLGYAHPLMPYLSADADEDDR